MGRNSFARPAISVRHQWYPFQPGFKILLWCNSCSKCSLNYAGWSAWCFYTVETRTLSRRFTPSTAHGSFDKSRAWNPLTAATEHALKEHMAKHDKVSTQDLLKITGRMQPDKPVGEQFLRTWRRNHKTHKGPKIAPSLWRVFDWEQLIRTMPSLASLGPRPLANHLVCVSHDLSPSNTVVIFVNPALFCETMKQLSNPGYIKLCGDGTFHLILGDWVLMNLPALTKHYAPVSAAGAFRPTFSPLLFGIANKESCPSYKALFDGASHCAHVCLDIDLPPRVCQYHCDWHAGEDAARRQCYPTSKRVADFAHFIGACVRSRLPVSADDTVQTYRSGFPQAMKKHALDPQWPTYLVSWVYVLRSCPSALLFHVMFERLIDCMLASDPPETACVDALRRHYLK